MRQRFGSWLWVIIALFLVSVAQAQRLSYLPLQSPGQASVAIDEGTKTAYIIDLGKDGPGDRVYFQGNLLLDQLENLTVKRLVFSCSHPHLDHMGGIKALFKDRNNFIRDGKPRFESITFIDDGVKITPLHKMFQALHVDPIVKAEYIPANGKNAFSKVSSAADAVFVENIPYAHDPKGNDHGSALVTKITLNSKYTIVDFDDASTTAIERVVAKLQGRPDLRVDAFVVPHHGSRYHDVEPILALNPKKAIITVNPENRYGHPSPEILLKLLEKLGPDNVVFTGSKGGVVLDGTGVAAAEYTAANRESFELFVEQGRLRAERLGRGKDVLQLYEQIESIMRPGGEPPEPLSSAVRLPIDPSPTPGTGGPARPGAGASAADLINNGTLLSSEFDIGEIRNGGRSAQELMDSSRLPGLPASARNRRRISVVGNPAATASRGGLSPTEIAKLASSHMLPGQGPLPDQLVTVDYQYAEGLADGLVASQTLQPTESTNLVTAMRTQAVPRGGMVFLDGGKLFPVGPAGELSGGTLDLCGLRYCIRPLAGSATSYSIPFAPGPLFSEVWGKVFRKQIKSFYLSINPTKRLLQAPADSLLSIPSDRLQFGTGTPPADAYNEVVTAGDIASSPIGDILWKADVAFKSASLGTNVLTGEHATPPPVALDRLEVADDRDLATDAEDRWCRLYWTSGSQRVRANAATHSLTFEGEAIVARSEPMLRKESHLAEWPRGTWCGEPKLVAQRLQRAVKAGTAPPELMQLRAVAEMQSFAKWAWENDMKPSPAFQKSIDSQQALVKETHVPKWTSGIRAKDAVYVEAEKRWAEKPWSIGLRVSTANPASAKRCIKEFYDDRMDHDFAKGGLKKRDGIWYYDESDRPFFAKWIDGVVSNVAHCTNGTVVSSALNASTSDDSIASEGGVDAAEYHVQPIHVHGGILLGSEKEARKARWLKDGRIALPDGRLILKRDADQLHFWSFDEKHPLFTSAGQHVVFSSGKVIDVETVDGRLRALVETTAGSVIRQEARVSAIPNRFGGAEWAEVREADGALIAQKVAWFCDEARHDEVCVANEDMKGFGDLIGAHNITPGLIIEPVKANLWLVDVDVESIRTFLDTQLKSTQATDIAGRLALIGQYTDWGFDEAANSLVRELQTSSESEDLILTREFDPSGLYTLGAVVALATLLDADSDSGAEFLNKLQRAEKIAASLPPRYSAPVWNALTKLCDGAADTFGGGAHAGRFKRISERYADKAALASALAEGAMNPWPHDADPDDDE